MTVSQLVVVIVGVIVLQLSAKMVQWRARRTRETAVELDREPEPYTELQELEEMQGEESPPQSPRSHFESNWWQQLEQTVQPVHVQFNSLSLTLKGGLVNCGNPHARGSDTLVSSVSGQFKPGRMVGIMGPSG